jgi:hypothetical protein
MVEQHPIHGIRRQPDSTFHDIVPLLFRARLCLILALALAHVSLNTLLRRLTL